MRYAFIRTYNPAYHSIILKHLRQREIELPDTSSEQDVSVTLRKLASKRTLTEDEKLLKTYLSEIGPTEQFTPGSYSLLNMSVKGPGRPDVNGLRELESELGSGGGKLVFTLQEASEDIADFYARYLKRPLERDLENGASSRQLMNYFVLSEIKQVPGLGVATQEEMEKAVGERARSVLKLLSATNLQVLAVEIEHLLSDHNSKPFEHLQLYGETENGKGSLFCRHRSERLDLEGYAQSEEKQVDLFLKPTRGFGIINRSIDLGWNDFVFPTYYVVEDKR